MSFGWSEIISATHLFRKIGEALKDSRGSASEFQDTVAFLESLDKTLTGLRSVLDHNPQLEWQVELAEPVQRLRSAVEQFKEDISKYESSLGADSERKKARRVPREVQFALSKRVKELKESLGWSMTILNHTILIQAVSSILNLAETTSLSYHTWEQQTHITSAQMLNNSRIL